VSVTEPPSFAVTWREVGDDFTALVRRFDDRSLSAWTYSFAEEATRPAARFWRLEPGRYELRAGPDADGDGKVDGHYRQKVGVTYRQRLDGARFDLPAKTLWLVEVVQVQRGPDRPRLMPDLAVMPRDITLEAKPTAGRSCKGKVVVHNIGSADAADINVRVCAAPAAQNAESTVVQRVRIAKLAFPADLRAKTAVAEFGWTPQAPGKYQLVVVVSTENRAAEIYSGNNRAQIEVVVE
jgi:hypothetical protein